MIRTLLDVPGEFAVLWADHDVAFRRDDRERLVHPTLGLIEVDCLNPFSEDGRQRLPWFTPAVGTDSAGLFDLLAVVGTQDIAGPGRRPGVGRTVRAGRRLRPPSARPPPRGAGRRG